MTLTLLLDLDDTLLDNNIDTFLPGYLKALARHLARFVPLEKVAPQILASTGKMVANLDPLRTLEEVFDADFYPALGVTKADLFDTLVEFYETVFPTLSSLTSPRPEAVKLVETAFERGWRVVVATNPLFPRRAIEHRLNWARLPVERYPFNLITSYEHMHFAKPNPAYFAEVLARLGWPQGPAVMVGNSLPDDLLPAAQAGLVGFWLTNDPAALPKDMPGLSRTGRMAEILPWLDEVEAAAPPTVISSPTTSLSTLQSTPAVLDSLGRAVPPELWGRPPLPGEWCFTEIICHLRDSDREINLLRLERIFQEENTFIPAVNADAWSAIRSYCSEDGREAITGFVESRMRLIHQLLSLAKEDWQRPTRHAIFGPTQLSELVGFIASHDRTHIQQAIQTLAAPSCESL
jgi:FMN phosphatase YigB (HAD superfamily)